MYTEKVFVTTIREEGYTDGKSYADMNGTVVVSSNANGVSVNCSNNSTLLKDTAWFKAFRQLPTAWL